MQERHPSGRETGFMAAHAAASAPHLDIKRAAERAPIWVIAIMAHVLAAAILGMVYVRSDTASARPEEATLVSSLADRPPKLQDPVAIEIPKDLLRLPALPEDAAPPDFGTGLPRDRDSLTGLLGGASETTPPAGPDSADGGGLPAPIGLGSAGSPAPAGGPRGIPNGANPRTIRIQEANLAKPQPVVKGGLRWLREHQSEDGAWDCDGFSLQCDPRHGPECRGAGAPTFDVGVTGLALLAFLGAGYDGRGRTPNDDAVKQGLKWLRESQDAQGCFGPRTDRFTYSHACATIAMCEAAAFNKSPTWRRSAQAGIDFVQACQTPYRGWRYDVRPVDSDASVTGWMLLALKAGKDAGLTVSDRAIRDGLAYLDALTSPETGRTGYTRPGDLPVRPPKLVEHWPARESESLTAVALCARIFLGREEGNPLTKAGASLIAKQMPEWDERKGSIDMYYWYYGTLAMHQLGGKPWEQWNESLERAVIQNQVEDGCGEGSWDPVDPWGEEGGRVYATALMTLCFEVYWRYPLVFGARK
jgi:hypothetical protein